VTKKTGGEKTSTKKKQQKDESKMVPGRSPRQRRKAKDQRGGRGSSKERRKGRKGEKIALNALAGGRKKGGNVSGREGKKLEKGGGKQRGKKTPRALRKSCSEKGSAGRGIT